MVKAIPNKIVPVDDEAAYKVFPRLLAFKGGLEDAKERT